MAAYFGKNFVVDYKDSFGFSEQWQNAKQQEDSEQEFIHESSNTSVVLSLLVMLSYSVTVWGRNVELFFSQAAAVRFSWVACLIAVFCLLADTSALFLSKYRANRY